MSARSITHDDLPVASRPVPRPWWDHPTLTIAIALLALAAGAAAAIHRGECVDRQGVEWRR